MVPIERKRPVEDSIAPVNLTKPFIYAIYLTS